MWLKFIGCDGFANGNGTEIYLRSETIIAFRGATSTDRSQFTKYDADWKLPETIIITEQTVWAVTTPLCDVVQMFQ